MSSVKLTKESAPQFIAAVATALAAMLHRLESPHPFSWLSRSRQSQTEKALRRLAAKPEFSESVHPLLARGFKDLFERMTIIEENAKKAAENAKPGSSPAHDTPAERLRKNQEASTGLRQRVREMERQVNEFVAAMASGQTYILERSASDNVPSAPATSAVPSPTESFPVAPETTLPPKASVPPILTHWNAFGRHNIP